MKIKMADAKGRGAMTLVEMLVVLATCVVIGMLLIPVPNSHARTKAIRINCASNLKQDGIAFKVWEGDNNDKFPMQALTNEQGAPIYATARDSFRYFLAMSNELSNPKVLFCPAENKKTFAPDWGPSFSSSNISYFIGLDARDALPASFLSGDNNISSDHPDVDGKLILNTNQPVEFGKERHNSSGNVLLSDGSVQQWSSNGLQQGITNTGLATNILLMNR